jgi:hypothetical protein
MNQLLQLPLNHRDTKKVRLFKVATCVEIRVEFCVNQRLSFNRPSLQNWGSRCEQTFTVVKLVLVAYL